MKLTKTFKNKLISSILGDIKEVDYNSQIRDYANKIYKKCEPEWFTKLKTEVPEALDYLVSQYAYVGGIKNKFGNVAFKGYEPVFDDEDKLYIDHLLEMKYKQREERGKIYEKLLANFENVSTLNQLKSNFPYLSLYIDKIVGNSQTKNLPATNDLKDVLKKLGCKLTKD